MTWSAPETRYARTTDGVHIAYQVVGDGPGDLVFIPGFVSNVEQSWEWPAMAAFQRRLARFSRLILFDRRGTGLSDHILPAGEHLTLEARMDDLRAVLDAVGSARPILFGYEEGFALCAVFAATFPDRVAALVAQAPSGLGLANADRPWAYTEASWDRYLGMVGEKWGTREFAEHEVRTAWPGVAESAEWSEQFANWMRRSVSPGDALVFLQVNAKTDISDVLSTIRTPTLVIQRVDDQVLPIGYARYVAAQIPGARLVELPGANHGYVAPDQDQVLDQVERFVREFRAEESELDRVLATVLFTDVVGSTDRAAQLGDRAWRDVLERHHSTVRAMAARYRGNEVETAGDGFFITFDGPARGVRCAQAIVSAVHALDLEVRAGLHTGEVETIDGKVGGIAVHIGARVCALAAPSQVLASQTVKDLVVGSGLVFEDAGEHELKGIPDRWHLYRVMNSPVAI